MSDLVGNHIVGFPTRRLKYFLLLPSFLKIMPPHPNIVSSPEPLGSQGELDVLLAGVSGGFSPGTPVFAPPTDWFRLDMSEKA